MPDVAILLSENAAPMSLAGALRPMDDSAKAIGGPQAFNPGVLDRTGKFRGQYVSIPHYVHNRILIYRKDRVTFDSAPVKDAVRYMLELARHTSGPSAIEYKISDNFSLVNSGRTSLTEDSAAIVAAAADAPRSPSSPTPLSCRSAKPSAT